VRASGTDEALIELAKKNALALSAGHSFIIFLGEGTYPVNVLNAVKMVPEVCRIYCATANPVEVVIAETAQGRGILGVVDGVKTKGVETEEDAAQRKAFLRTIGYKL
jgi:adenosine/AMP kinase